MKDESDGKGQRRNPVVSRSELIKHMEQRRLRAFPSAAKVAGSAANEVA